MFFRLHRFDSGLTFPSVALLFCRYTNELARLRVKDLRNLSASLQLSTIGLRPDLTSRLVEKEAAALRDKLEAEAKIQGEKFRKANRASLRISVTSTPRSSGATPLTSPQDYTPGSALRVNSRQLMQHRKRAVRSELQAVEKVVSIDKKLASDATLSVAHRQRLAAIAARKDELNAALLNSCGLTGLKRLRRVGIQGHHFDECVLTLRSCCVVMPLCLCVDATSEIYSC